MTKTTTYTYNMDGSLNQLIYPASGRKINFTVSAAGRTTVMQQDVSQGGFIYATNPVTGPMYSPQGTLQGMKNAIYGSFQGFSESRSYDSRLRLSAVVATNSSGGTAFSHNYSYYANGNLNVDTNNLDNGRNITYGYDPLNRVTSATSQANSGVDCWGQGITYDQYGNIPGITSTKTGCSAPILNAPPDPATNRLAGYSYDAAGDLLSDGPCSYTWDAEGRQTAVSGTGPCSSASYTYDGDGQRVKKVVGANTTLYWYGAGSNILTETDGAGTLQKDYIYFAGQRLAYVYNSSVYYYRGDPIGSSRGVTWSIGTLCQDSDYTPFGSEIAHTSSCSQNYKFAAMERDSETGNDHTQNRQYASNFGRWLSPDPAGKKAVSLDDPQTWNMYSYVRDLPTVRTDPLGLFDCSGEKAKLVGCAYLINWNKEHGISPKAKVSNAPGVPVKLPNGNTVPDSKSPTGKLMSPTADLSSVAAAGRAIKQEAGDDAKGTHVRAALQTIYEGLKQGASHNGDFDYQRVSFDGSGDLQQLPQFRDVANFNVGLLGQQAGLSLDLLLTAAGQYAKQTKSPSYDANEPYGLVPQTREWEEIGYHIGESGLYDQ